LIRRGARQHVCAFVMRGGFFVPHFQIGGPAVQPVLVDGLQLRSRRSTPDHLSWFLIDEARGDFVLARLAVA
jgi:hypothetical protein